MAKLKLTNGLKRIVFSRDDDEFGAHNGGDPADIVAKFPSGEEWAVRIRNGIVGEIGDSIAPDETFRPNLPGAMAVIAAKDRSGVLEFFSARTGQKMHTPGNVR